jgi:UDP-N-acetylglucosamine--N-acetylmuramyl-(pentapeptide) pyrophosphoryl-undecaprenol N-acetylglucosamine transferase
LIVATLGTHEQRFDRMLELVLPLAADEQLVVQHGHTPARPGWDGVRWIDFAPRDEVVEYMRAASAVICHAGVGSIMTALLARKLPVVVPRLRSLDEHVDDHQLQIARELHSRRLAIACMRGDSIALALAAARGASPRREPDKRLVTAIADAVTGRTRY